MEKMLCVIVEPEKKPYIAYIPDTFEARQDIVDGRVDFLVFDDKAEVIFNENFQSLYLPLNRVLFDESNLTRFAIRGTFIIVGAAANADWTSLSQEDAEKYVKIFQGFQVPWDSDYWPLERIESYRDWFLYNPE